MFLLKYMLMMFILQSKTFIRSPRRRARRFALCRPIDTRQISSSSKMSATYTVLRSLVRMRGSIISCQAASLKDCASPRLGYCRL